MDVIVAMKTGDGQTETFEVMIVNERETHIWRRISRTERTIAFVMLWALAADSMSRVQLLIASFKTKKRRNVKLCSRKGKRKKKRRNARKRKRSKKNRSDGRKKKKSFQRERKEGGDLKDEVVLIRAVVAEVEAIAVTAVHHTVHTPHEAMEVYPQGRHIADALRHLIQAIVAVHHLPIVVDEAEVAVGVVHHIQVTAAGPTVGVTVVETSNLQKENATALFRRHGRNHPTIEKSVENKTNHRE
mmetsp:Transcript_14731/g.23032  ORF Transcript_14731/g.23032 Transcript_14731/m.23032 type:complete len:244 (-) Transcript_14731:1024-1755(-)